MTFELKEAISLIIFIATIATLWNTFGNKIKNLSDRVKTLMRVVFKDGGVLNLITIDACKRERELKDEIIDTVKASLTDIKKEIQDLKRELQDLKESVLIIITSMNIDKKDIDKIKKGK